MSYELEKELTRIGALLAGQHEEFKQSSEKLLDYYRELRRWLAEASAENMRLRHENERLRKCAADPENCR
jgi:regulator of replication initiation timing